MQTDNDDAELMMELLYLWIVAHGGRPACYSGIYASDYGKPREEMTEFSRRILGFADALGLHGVYNPDSPPMRKLILFARKTPENRFDDAYLRKMLGFKYGKVDYFSDRTSSLVPTIWATVKGCKEKIGLWAYKARDIPASRTYAKSILKKWQTLLHEHPFPFGKVKLSLEIKLMEGYLDRAKRLHDTLYFLKNYNNFIGDLEEIRAPPTVIQDMLIRPHTQKDIATRKELWLRAMQRFLPV